MCKVITRKQKENVLSIAQEITFARALSSNDKRLRDTALKKLNKWFFMKSRKVTSGPRFSEEGFMRLCKGLYYCVWMSDKPLYQEDIAESISCLVHCFSRPDEVLDFIRCFFQTISNSWSVLDGHRMDKYLLLVRRFVRQTLEYLRKSDWKQEFVELYCKTFYTIILNFPLGLNLHLTEIFLEELAKVGRGELNPNIVTELLKPFADLMISSSDSRLLNHVIDYIFLQLLRQSEEGIKHQSKFEAWKKMGYPEGHIDVLEEIEVEEGGEQSDIDPIDEDGEELDPRAGRVDVYLLPINFNAADIRNYLQLLLKKKETTTKARKAINHVVKKYNVFIKGKYPLGIHKVELPEIEDIEKVVEEAAEELLAEEMDDYKDAKRMNKLIRPEHHGGWTVTSIGEEDSFIRSVRSSVFSTTNNWEIQSITKKRHLKSVEKPNIVGTLKKMKVTTDKSLLMK